MGLFKQMKDMKDMAHEAPGMLAQGNQLAEAAKANAAAQQAAAAQMNAPTAPPAAASPAGSDQIEGVDLALFATISRSFAGVAYDQAAWARAGRPTRRRTDAMAGRHGRLERSHRRGPIGGRAVQRALHGPLTWACSRTSTPSSDRRRR